jgi:hypothetical protein
MNNPIVNSLRHLNKDVFFCCIIYIDLEEMAIYQIVTSKTNGCIDKDINTITVEINKTIHHVTNNGYVGDNN